MAAKHPPVLRAPDIDAALHARVVAAAMLDAACDKLAIAYQQLRDANESLARTVAARPAVDDYLTGPACLDATVRSVLFETGFEWALPMPPRHRPERHPSIMGRAIELNDALREALARRTREPVR